MYHFPTILKRARFFELGHFKKALLAIKAIRDEKKRFDTLVQYAHYLPHALLENLLVKAQSLTEEVEQARVMSILLPISREQLVSQELIRSIQDEKLQDELLSTSALHQANSGQWKNALANVEAIKYGPTKLTVFERLIPYLPEFSLEIIKIISRYGFQRVKRLLELYACLVTESEQSQQQLATLKILENTTFKSVSNNEQIQQQDKFVIPNELKALIKALEHITQDEEHLKVLVNLCTFLKKSGKLREFAFVIQAIKDEEQRSILLSQLPSQENESREDISIDDEYQSIIREIRNIAEEDYGILDKLILNSTGSNNLAEISILVQAIENIFGDFSDLHHSDHREFSQFLLHLGDSSETTKISQRNQNELQSLQLMTTIPNQVEGSDIAEEIDFAKVIKDFGDDYLSSRFLVELAARLTQLGYSQKAILVLQLIDEEKLQSLPLITTISGQVEESDIVELTEFAKLIKDIDNGNYLGSRLLVELAARLTQLGYSQKAILVLQQIDEEKLQSLNLIDKLSSQLRSMSNSPEVLSVFRFLETQNQLRKKEIENLSNSTDMNCLSEILAAVELIEDKKQQAQVHLELISTLPKLLAQKFLAVSKSQIKELLRATQSIEDEVYQTNALLQLVPYFPCSLNQALQELLLEITRNTNDELAKAKTLITISPCLSLKFLEEAVTIAQAFENQCLKVRVKVTITSQLPEPLKSDIFEAILEQTRSIEDVDLREAMLCDLATYSPLSFLYKLYKTLEINGFAFLILKKRLKNLSHIISDMSGDSVTGEELPRIELHARSEITLKDTEIDYTEELRRILAIEDEFYRATELAFLEPHLTKSLLREALVQILPLHDKLFNSFILNILFSNFNFCELPPSLALEVAKSIDNDLQQALLLSQLVLYLPSNLLCEALEIAKNVQGAKKAEILQALLKRLSELGYIKESLILLQALKNSIVQPALEELTLNVLELPKGDELQGILIALKMVEDIAWKATFLSGLAPYFPEPSKTQLLEESLSIVKKLDNKYQQIEVLIEVVSHLPDIEKIKWLWKIVTATQNLQDRNKKRKLLNLLTHRFTSWGYLREIEIFLHELETRNVQSSIEAAPFTLPISESLDDSVFSKLLLIMSMVQDENEQVNIIEELSLLLVSQGYYQNALSAASLVKSATRRVKLLNRIVPDLPETLSIKVFRGSVDFSRKINSVSERAKALLDSVYYCPKSLTSLKYDLLKEVFDIGERAFNTTGQKELLVTAGRCFMECGYFEEVANAFKEFENQPNPIGSGLTPQQLNLDDCILERLLLILKVVHDKSELVDILTELATLLPDSKKELVIKQAWQISLIIQDDFQRARVLLKIYDQLPKQFKESALEKVIKSVTKVEDRIKRHELLKRFLLYLIPLQPIKLYPLWQKLLRSLAFFDREDFLSDLFLLSPIIFKLGGSEAVERVACAILDVGEWWSVEKLEV